MKPKKKQKLEPGDLLEIRCHRPGVEYHKDRTILDANRVFVRFQGREMTLAEALSGIQARVALDAKPIGHGG
jgi:hypothetical protein